MGKPGWSSLIALAFALALAGCGGGGGSSSAPSASGKFYLRDAAAVPVRDQGNNVVFTMTELWLTVTGAKLETQGGVDVPITLATSPLRIDIMTLTGTSTLLGFGAFPAGTYKEVELTVSAAEMVGTAAGSVSLTTVAVGVSSGEFEAEFSPAVAVTANATTSFVIDWTPSVRATVGAGPTTYTLEDEVKAYVLGGAGAGSPATQGVHDLEGDIASIDCAAQTIVIAEHGVSFTVTVHAGTLYEQSHSLTLPGGCSALAVGDEIEVDGVLQSNGTILADKVELESQSSGGSGSGGSGGGSTSGQFEIEGRVANRSSTGAFTFDIFQGGTLAAHVTTTAATVYEDDDNHATTAAAILDGEKVEVKGTITTAGSPPTVEATKVELDD